MVLTVKSKGEKPTKRRRVSQKGPGGDAPVEEVVVNVEDEGEDKGEAEVETPAAAAPKRRRKTAKARWAKADDGEVDEEAEMAKRWAEADEAGDGKADGKEVEAVEAHDVKGMDEELRLRELLGLSTSPCE